MNENIFDEVYYQQSKRTTKMIIDKDCVDAIRKVDIPGFDEEAESLGIDLMGYDGSCHSSEDRRDIVKAIVLLGTGKEVPQDLKERILKRKKLA